MSDPFSQGTDAMQQIGQRNYCMRPPPLLSDMPCASKCKGASNRKMILVTHSCNQFSTSENVHSRAPYFVKSKEHSQTSFRK